MKILQTAPELGKVFNRYGCKARGLIGGVETFLGEEMSTKTLLGVIERALLVGVLNAKMGLHIEISPRRLMQYAFEAYGRHDLRGDQVGRLISGKVQWWAGGDEITFSLLHHKTRTVDGHWLEGNKWLQAVWNPDPTVEIGGLESIEFYQIWGAA